MQKSGTDPATIFTALELYRGEKEERFPFIACICCARKPRSSGLPFVVCGAGRYCFAGMQSHFNPCDPEGRNISLLPIFCMIIFFQSLHPTRGATVKVNGNTSSKRKTRQIVLAPYGFPLYIAPFEKSSKKTESRFPTHLSSISHVFSFFEGDRDDRRSVSLCFLYRCVRKPRPSGLPFVPVAAPFHL